MKAIAFLFVIFTVLIVALADIGVLPPFIRRLYDFPNGDKVGHFILFGLLNFFLSSAFLSRFVHNRKRTALSVGLILAAAVAAEEFSQQFFAARTFDLIDLIASYLGLIMGGWLVFRFFAK